MPKRRSPATGQADPSNEPVDPPPPSRSRLQDRLRLVGWAVLIVTLLAYAAAWGAPLDWRLDLASHFPVQRAIAFAAAGLLFLSGRGFRSAAFAATLAALQLAAIVPFWLPGPNANDAGPLRRGVTMNLLASNEDRDPTAAFLRSEEYDFVALQELTPQWAEKIATLDDAYPHQALYPRAGPFGIGLISRKPILARRLIVLANASYPTLEATIALEGGEATVLVTHPPPPLGAENAERRDRHLAALAERAREIDGPVLVVGDLNVTPWSPTFRKLLTESGLSDARIGHGVAATWPAALGPLGIPIDHVLVSADVDVATLKAGPSLGSDHLPVEFEFRVRMPPE